MNYLSTLRTGLMSGRYNLAIAAFLFAAIFLLMPHAAWAQSDPLATATDAAETVQKSFQKFALIVGGIGLVACLMLGFFGKLNWKWVATGIGVSFGLAIIPTSIGWLASLGN